MDKVTDNALEQSSAMSYASSKLKDDCLSESSFGHSIGDSVSQKQSGAENTIQTNVMNLCITANESTLDDEQVEEVIEKPNTKLNKAYLRKLDRKYKNSLFKGKFSTGRLTNTSKSVYSFEGEVLSEEDDEYNTDSSFETTQKIKIDEEDDQMSDNPAEAQPMEIDHYRMRDYKNYDQYSQISGFSILDQQEHFFENVV